jgi:hypothetical protein
VEPASARPRRALAISLGLYLILLLASFYPQSRRPTDTVAYVGDALESVYIVAWHARQLPRDPLHPFDSGILYPVPHAVTFIEHRLFPSWLVAPVVWISGNPVLAYNLAVGLACIAAALAARDLAGRLGASALGAWVAGALYGFHTYQVNEAPRLQIVWHAFTVIALAQLLAFLKTGRRRHAWLVAGAMLLQGLSCHYHLVYGATLLALVLLGCLVWRPRWLLARLPSLILPAAVAVLLFLPVIVPYVRTALAYRFTREPPRGVDLQHYVSTPATNLLYGAMGAPVRVQQQGPHFVGFAALGLAALAWSRRRAEGSAGLVDARVWVPAATAAALLFVALSLGREAYAFGHRLGPGPYLLLHRFVPGFSLIRIPERLGILAMLFVALLAGRGVTVLQRARLAAPAWLLAGLVPFEHLATLPLTTRVPVGRDVPAVYRWLATEPVQALAEVPVHGEGLVRKESLEQYFSTVHGKPIIHGYVSYPPLVTTLLRRLAAEFPSRLSLEGLTRAGVDTVVAHQGRDPTLPPRLASSLAAGLVERRAVFSGPLASLYEGTADEVYRFRVPLSIESAPFPSGGRVTGPGWHWRAKLGDPRLAGDGSMSTAWVVERALLGDEFCEVTFEAPVAVSGVVLRLRQDSAFPSRFKLAGRMPGGEWVPLAWYDAPHFMQLLGHLLEDPRTPALGFALDGRVLSGVRLMVEPGGESFLGWSLPEMEVWGPEASPKEPPRA